MVYLGTPLFETSHPSAMEVIVAKDGLSVKCRFKTYQNNDFYPQYNVEVVVSSASLCLGLELKVLT